MSLLYESNTFTIRAEHTPRFHGSISTWPRNSNSPFTHIKRLVLTHCEAMANRNWDSTSIRPSLNLVSLHAFRPKELTVIFLYGRPKVVTIPLSDEIIRILGTFRGLKAFGIDMNMGLDKVECGKIEHAVTAMEAVFREFTYLKWGAVGRRSKEEDQIRRRLCGRFQEPSDEADASRTLADQ